MKVSGQMPENSDMAVLCPTVANRPYFRRVCLACGIGVCLALADSDCLAAQRSLLNLNGLRQWVDLGYQYDGSSSKSDRGADRSSHQHRFEETYHAGINYTIYDRRLLTGRLDFDLGANQGVLSEQNVDSGGGSSGAELAYKVDGVIGNRSSIPISFFSSSQKNRVSNPFSRSYDMESDSTGVSVTIKNRHLPALFAYSSFGHQTDGLQLDRKQATETINLVVNNNYQGVSLTEAKVLWISDRTDFLGPAAAQSTDSYAASARNTLTWRPAAGESSLDSSYLRREEAGTRQSVTSSWDEDLRLRLGRGLQVGLGYGYSADENLTQSKVKNSARGWLQHQFLQNLATRLEVRGSENEYSSGSERSVLGSLNLDYRRNLPGQSVLQLGFGQALGTTDRNLDAQQLFESGESLIVQLFDNYLGQPDIFPESIVVRNADRTLIYQQGSDYTVRPDGRRTELVFPAGSPIEQNDLLSIAYRYRVSSKLKYSNDTRSLSASLMLYKNLFRAYASLIDSSQKLLSGEDDAGNLNPMQTWVLGFETTLPKLSFGGSYTSQDTTIDKTRTLEGTVQYERQIDSGTLLLRINDRYSMYDHATDFQGDAKSSGADNSFNLSADYRKPIGRNANLALKGNFLNLQGEARDRTDLNLGLNLEMRFGRFEALLVSSVGWQFNPGARDREDYLFLKLRRYL